jgi:hypothetical protein
LISALHDSALGGHSGIQSTYQRLKKLFWWKGLKGDVENFVKQCSVCRQAKHERVHPAGLLQPLPIPQGVWQDLSLDFIEGLPKSEGYSCILVVVDRYSKYAHFFLLHHPFTASQVAQLFLDNIVKLHGVPKTLVSDRDKVFTSLFWKHLFQLLQTKLAMSAAYHPQSDGQTERVNQCLEMYLCCAVHATPGKWKKWLPLTEFWYNTTFHSSLGCTPFKVLYGYDVSFAAAPTIPSECEKSVVDLLLDRAAHSAMLREKLAAAQNRMKIQANKQRTDREFAVVEAATICSTFRGELSLPKACIQIFWPF